MMNYLLKIEDEYLEDEVRDGFYISSMTKRAWAMELTVLNLIDNICNKYKIQYFADYGTYLGAVRHGGFVPWDDDLDICMKRKDYQRFLEVAEKELPKDYKIYTFKNNDFTWKFLANVTSNEHMCFDPEYLKNNYSFPYMVGVDIFVIDNIDGCYEKEIIQNKAVKKLLAITDVCDEEIINANDQYKTIDELNNTNITKYFNFAKHEYNFNIKSSIPYIEFKRLIYSEVDRRISIKKDYITDNVIQKIPWGVYHNATIPSDLYNECIRIPFEMITIPVPLKYNMGLRIKYGYNFMEIVMGNSGHFYPYFEEQKKNLGSEYDYPAVFKFDKYKVGNSDKEYKGSLKCISKEIIVYLTKSNDLIKTLIEKMILGKTSHSTDYLFEFFSDIQKTIIDYGTLIESFIHDVNETVTLLENYCEQLFNIYSFIQSNVAEKNCITEKMDFLTDNIIKSINSKIIKRRKVVFVSVKAKHWPSLESIYNYEVKREDTDVYVLSVPYSYKEYNGMTRFETFNDIEFLKKYVDESIVVDSLDFSLICPDVVYINNPYDNYNMSYTVLESYYSSNIKKYTDNLIYIPFFKLSEFTRNQYQFWYNMQFYCTVPGVIYADKILVQSSNIRDRYIEKLEEWSGEYGVWDNKINIITHEFSDYRITQPGLPNSITSILDIERNNGKEIKIWYLCTGIMAERNEQFFNVIEYELEQLIKECDRQFIVLVTDTYFDDTVKKKRPQFIERLNYFYLLFLESKIGIIANKLIDVNKYRLQLASYADSFLGNGSIMFKDFIVLDKIKDTEVMKFELED